MALLVFSEKRYEKKNKDKEREREREREREKCHDTIACPNE